MPHYESSFQAQLIQQFLVEEHQVPQVVQVLQPLGLGHAGVGRCDDVELGCQAVQAIVPTGEATGAVQVEEVVAAAALNQLDIKLSPAQGDEPFGVLGQGGTSRRSYGRSDEEGGCP